MSDCLYPRAELPEWRRSGRFFLIALLLHGVALFYPLRKALETIDLPPPAMLVELVKPAAPLPVALPPAPVKKEIRTPPPPPKHTPAPPRPVLALAAKPDSPPPVYTVPVPPPTPPAPVTTAPLTSAAPAVSAAAPAAISTARYDAAYLNNPKPNYPPLSRRLGEEGKVLLKVRVTREGLPASVELEKTSHFDRLDEAARQAISRWRFIPARRGDEAVEASVIVPIVFRLDS